ncbi:DUF4181 domain-containing protein [Solibacillus sp. CAU 1738]|uniref:DUF4181 domain-containing protein n=1 Tax=Solibacillus sp. CAU 1738 TaxID=3140363 RepID=UPI00326094E0
MIVSIIFASFIAAGIMDLTLRKKLNIEKNEKFMDQYISKKHFIFEIVLIVLFLTGISTNGYSGKYLYMLLFLFFSVLFVIRAAVEFIFLRDKRKHIISFAYTMICLLCALAIVLLL